MTGFFGRIAARINGTRVPDGFTGTLDRTEHVLATAHGRTGCVVATSLGLWLPGDDGHRRVGWHRISKAQWDNPTLTVIEADVEDTVVEAEILADRAPQRFALTAAGRLPQVVQLRVERSIASRHHRELPGGAAWFVQRKVPGADGTVLQVRADPGVDPETVRTLTKNVVRRLTP